MHFKANLLLATLQLAAATPIAMPQGTGSGADSCPSEDLIAATWTKNKVDDVLTNAAKNLTTNNVQGLAASLGAPNFFWYGLVAIQNYNSYMNSLSTAVAFATSIMALEIPQVITDFYPKPQDNVTPIKDLNAIITFGLSVVPFTGALGKVSTIATGVSGLLTGRLKAPEAPDLFVKWSELGVSLAAAAKAYQSTISTSLQNTLDAKIDDKDNGINALLTGGQFLGVSQNFTQADMQAKMSTNMKLRAIALALQAQKAFIYRNKVGGTYDGNCRLRIGEEERPDILTLIGKKYGISGKIIQEGPSNCFDKHGVQLYTPDILPLDAKDDSCIFNLNVCTFNPDTFPGKTIQENCNLQGIST
ncbi:hypothetical protein BKA61DRAFT_710328 [Leptodontidium sp. MPI-SDFR-AT-0119]|nr:hypothetical protein BKA61DRAFT_710328 [Leptodontidium sp. MPI-SDFR-AT-0119]